MTDVEFTRLARLVALDTVSPLDEPRLAACAEELAAWGCRRIGEELLGRGDPMSPIWLYGHVDTKPPRPGEDWLTDPFTLTEQDGSWFGLGSSDSKAQLLNALLVTDPDRHFVLIDTSEEHDGTAAAGEFVAAHAPRALVVCDGASPEGVDAYTGYSGQADGVVRLNTGRAPQHPARGGGDVVALVRSFLDDAQRRGLHVTVTGLSAPATERSLSLQRVDLRFDLRFGTAETAQVRELLDGWPTELRQWMEPVEGEERVELPGLVVAGRAAFSNRLGARGPLGVRHLLVVPGADTDNRNHQPNEFIRPERIRRQRAVLRRVLDRLEEFYR
ncbi:M20/M25/M40 family metallo-hydrolase [Saccharothrix isguenensis]